MRQIVWTLAFLLLIGCSSTKSKVRVSGLAVVDVNRDQIFEMLKVSDKLEGIKTQSISNLGTVTCEKQNCRFPIKGKAPLRVNGDRQGLAKVQAECVFDRQSMNELIQVMDKARVTEKDQSFSGESGKVHCKQNFCELWFNLNTRDDFSVSRLLRDSMGIQVTL